MRGYIELGATPSDEDCAQVGSDDYSEKSRAEARRYIAQLNRMFPVMPAGCYFARKGFPHDFGTYHEIVIYFNEDDEEQSDFAYSIEDKLPHKWDDGPVGDAEAEQPTV